MGSACSTRRPTSTVRSWYRSGWTCGHPAPAGLARHLRTELGTDPATDAATSVFAELTTLEAAVSASELDTEARARLITRLKSLQWKLDTADEDEPGEDGDDADLAAST